jgi:phosphoglycolate phosphatase
LRAGVRAFPFCSGLEAKKIEQEKRETRESDRLAEISRFSRFSCFCYDDPNMSDIHLVVFDLDGTLVDSSLDLANAVNMVLGEFGVHRLPDPEIVSMVGEGAAVLVRRALTASGLDPDTPGALDRFLVHYHAHLLDHTRPYPGMVETLANLAGRMPIAVLTNKPGYATDRILEGLGIRQYFRATLGGDTPFGRKPVPAGLAHLARVVDTAIASVLLVGDSPVDLATARNAGARICLARYGFGYRFAPEDFRGDETFIDAPADLVDVLPGG